MNDSQSPRTRMTRGRRRRTGSPPCAPAHTRIGINHLVRPATGLVAVLAALAIAGCGGGDDTTGSDATVAAQPDLERYCELVTELDRNSTAIFREIEAEGIPTEEQLAAAQVRVLDENADLIAEMEAVAPAEIRADVELSIESARQRAETADATQPSKAVADAGVRLLKFRRANCGRAQ